MTTKNTLYRPPKRRLISPAGVGYLLGAVVFSVAMALLSWSTALTKEPTGVAELRLRLTAEATAGAPDEAPVTYIPWYPPGTSPGTLPAVSSLPPARREAPFTLMPDAPMLPSAEGFISLLGEPAGNAGMWIRSAYDNTAGLMAGPWVPRNVVTSPDGLRLDVTATGDRETPYEIAEVQSRLFYGYGRYEVVMRPARGSGLVSTFFTYVGPAQGSSHEEIDFEFLGRDTTSVHLNYWHNGRHGAAADIELPFDAAEADHLYAFDWKPEGVFWYVDGRLVYQTEPGDPNLPRGASKILMSNWTGRLPKWHGRADFGDSASAHYACVSFTPLGQNTRRCSDVFQLPKR
ncbi:MAG: family 16 glycosylhydrolase [Hyphomonas sp.]|nr:family 16 glycosylhydrolase [Hyphomonas sp.]